MLPRITFAEKCGTYTNLERRVQLLKVGLHRNDSARSEAWVFSQLAERLNPGILPETSSADTMDEIGTVASIYRGITHGRLESEGSLVLRTHPDSPQPTQVLYASRQHNGLQWPCTEDGHPGTASLYVEGFGERKAEPMTPAFWASCSAVAAGTSYVVQPWPSAAAAAPRNGSCKGQEKHDPARGMGGIESYRRLG